MSYCRWGTDSHSCDIYAYQDVRGGWTTHVAHSKVVGDNRPHVEWSLLLSSDNGDVDKFWRQYQALRGWLETAPRQPIGLPCDGETFNDPTLEAFRDRLLSLRAMGYSFPDYVIEAVDEEIAEAADGI